MATLDKIGFLIGGVQKGGTTALFAYLQAHPSLEMAPCKEVHFFDDENNVDWHQPDYERYHAAFGPPSSKVRGEATPIYLYWPNCLERIRAYNPYMRLVFLFRDPISRAYSHWKMETTRGFEDKPFAWAIRDGRARVTDPQAPGHHRVYSFVERGFYAAQLKRVYEIFPRENVLLLDSNDLHNNPEETLARVCTHVGVEPFEVREPLRANVGPGSDIIPDLTPEDRTHLRAIYWEDMAAFTTLSGITFEDFAQ